MDHHVIIKRARQALGLTQTAFGRKLGVSKQIVSYMENGHQKPSKEVLARFWELVESEGLRDIAGNAAAPTTDDHIVMMYRMLPDPEREQVANLIKMLSKK